MGEVEIVFANSDFQRLAEDEGFTMGYASAVERKYRQRIAYVAGARDERDFYALKSLHYEKLRGAREGQRSMRLNDQWRLIIRVYRIDEEAVVAVLGIEDYH